MSNPTSSNSNAPNNASRPTIFLLALDQQSFWDELYSNLVDSLAAKATIKRAVKPQPALTYLTNNTPSAIIVTDPAIVKSKATTNAVRDKVIEYARGGGIVVLATLFSSFVRPDDLSNWFRTSWDLPWESGDYHRTTVHLDSECRMRQLNQTVLPEEYSQKAVFLKNVAKDDAVYLPSANSRIESMVFAPSPVECEQTPVVFAKIGEGWLGYIGDVNNESGSQAVVLAMCGL
ncbi:MAG: hypothetical protein M1812_005337 [Candelaria pacifica]|nr:MAG: hypothetical protein M1812_005337 [Candelaria pacifica]